MYLAKFEKTIQVSEDSWRVVWVEKLFNNDTSIEEITSWAKDNEGFRKTSIGHKKVQELGIVITEPDI